MNGELLVTTRRFIHPWRRQAGTRKELSDGTPTVGIVSERLLVIFDGDDTLWETEELYEHARQRIGALLLRQGFDGDRWEMVERKIDLERVGSEGYVWHRFPRSCLLAFKEIAPDSPLVIRVTVSVRIFAIAFSVFLAQPRLAPHADEVLQHTAKFADLVLLTKGQPWVQRRRIRQSGLRRHFVKTVVVPDKTSAVFAELARSRGAGQCVVSVGNSIASDIEPAVAAGLAAVHVDGPMWEHERRAPGLGCTAAWQVRDLQSAVAALRQISNDRCNGEVGAKIAV